MAKAPGELYERETTPPRLPEITPQAYPSSDYSFTLQAVMEMQKTLGQLTQAVITLTEESKEIKGKLNRIGNKVNAAQVGLVISGVVLSAIGSAAVYILCEIWKVISPLIKIKLCAKIDIKKTNAPLHLRVTVYIRLKR